MDGKTAVEKMRGLVRRCSNRQLTEVINGLNKHPDPELVRLPLAIALAEHSKRIESWLVDRFAHTGPGSMVKPYEVAEALAREFGATPGRYAATVGEFLSRRAA